MKTKIALFTALISVSISGHAIQLQVPSNDAGWYYSLGGQNAITPPPSYDTNSVVLGASANWGAGFNCSAFNPVLGVANSLNQVKNGADAMQSQVVGAATGAIASLPLLMLQRANPGLYDMLTNSLASAKQRVTLATKSCEEMQQNISDGKNPLQDWINLSKQRDWRTQMGNGAYRSASVDATQAKENVDKSGGKNGIDWIGGKQAGGQGQPPIRIPTDIVKAGYNQALNRSATDDAPATDLTSRAAQLWPTPEAAEEWSRSVLGEERISTATGTEPKTMPGRGLNYEISQSVKKLTPKFDALISGSTEMNGDTLGDISAPNVLITSDIITSLKEMKPVERKILEGRLVQEVATARNVEKALIMKRLIVAGLQEPNVYSSGAASEDTQHHLDVLSQSVNNVLFEVEVNKKLASVTSETIRNLNQYNVNMTNSISKGTPKAAYHEVNGGVVRNNQ